MQYYTPYWWLVCGGTERGRGGAKAGGSEAGGGREGGGDPGNADGIENQSAKDFEARQEARQEGEERQCQEGSPDPKAQQATSYQVFPGRRC